MQNPNIQVEERPLPTNPLTMRDILANKKHLSTKQGIREYRSTDDLPRRKQHHQKEIKSLPVTD